MELFAKVSNDKEDSARKSYHVNLLIKIMQNSFTAIEKCKVPVIGVINGFCLGGGVDLVSACDILILTEDSKLSIREVKIGMAADLGSLSRLPLTTNNWSLLNELAFTGRIFGIEVCKELGLGSYVFKDFEGAIGKARQIAAEIAENSPVAVYGTKKVISHSKNKMVTEGLDFVREHNQSALLTDDMVKAVQAVMMKEKVMFPKL